MLSCHILTAHFKPKHVFLNKILNVYFLLHTPQHCLKHSGQQIMYSMYYSIIYYDMWYASVAVVDFV